MNTASIPKATFDGVTNAINREDWKILRGLVKDRMNADVSIGKWERNPVRVGKLMSVENDFKLNGERCTKYSFALEYKDGGLHPHWLQVLVREEIGQSTILDFGEFGW